MSKHIESVGNYLASEFVKWLTRSFFIGFSIIVVFLFTPVYDKLEALWSLPEKLVLIEEQILELRQITRTLTGEDRIIKQTAGLSYVREPVYKGQNVTLVIVAERTESGKNCVIKGSQSVFMDEGRIPTPGTRPNATTGHNISNTPTTMSVELTPPDSLRPGRVEVYLILEYECDGETKFDRTQTLPFKLLSTQD